MTMLVQLSQTDSVESRRLLHEVANRYVAVPHQLSMTQGKASPVDEGFPSKCQDHPHPGPADGTAVHSGLLSKGEIGHSLLWFERQTKYVEGPPKIVQEVDGSFVSHSRYDDEDGDTDGCNDAYDSDAKATNESDHAGIHW
jgi:hypothetical protein